MRNWHKWDKCGFQAGDTTCRRTLDGGMELYELNSAYVSEEEEEEAGSVLFYYAALYVL